jgi:AraC-like DNA-binding protein
VKISYSSYGSLRREGPGGTGGFVDVPSKRALPDRSEISNARERYERTFDEYLIYCYRNRTVARVSELAQFINSNRPNLSRAVVEIFGEPLGAILRRKPIERAVLLLVGSRLAVDDVAAASAFGHRSSFFRRFRKAFGMSPNEYRSKATKCD